MQCNRFASKNKRRHVLTCYINIQHVTPVNCKHVLALHTIFSLTKTCKTCVLFSLKFIPLHKAFHSNIQPDSQSTGSHFPLKNLPSLDNNLFQISNSTIATPLRMTHFYADNQNWGTLGKKKKHRHNICCKERLHMDAATFCKGIKQRIMKAVHVY